MSPAFYSIIQVHVHQLKYKRKAASWLVVEHLIELDNLRVGGQSPQCLNLSYIVHLKEKPFKY